MQRSPRAGVPVQMQKSPPLPTWRSKYTRKVKSLGITQLVLAGVTVLACAVNIIFNYYSYNGLSVPPICGAVTTFVPAGILAILSVTMALSARKCLIIACMVLSILAACFAGINIPVAVAAIDDHYHTSNAAVRISMDLIVILVSLAELVIAVLTAVYCCWMMSELQPFKNSMVQYTAVPGYHMVNQPVPMGYSAGVYAPNMQMMVGNPAVMNQAPPQIPNYTSDASTTGDKAEDK